MPVMKFSAGDRVVLKSVPAKYGRVLTFGETGRIQSNRNGNCTVIFDTVRNENSAYGVFYIDEHYLAPEDNLGTGFIVKDRNPCAYIEHELNPIETINRAIDKINKEENTMSQIPMLPNFHVVGVVYPDTVKTYAYALYDEGVQVGDHVVVRNSNGTMAVTQVMSINELPRDQVKNGCEVVCPVFMGPYNDRQAKAKQIHDLKKEMDEKVAQLQATALYEMMAERDPALKAMLEQFKALTE